MSRRGFLAAGCAACATATGIVASPRTARANQASDKPRIRIVYSLHGTKQPGPDWPNVGFDFQPVMDRITSALSRGCEDFELIPSMANGPEAAAKILEEDKTSGIDGYLVYQMNCWNRVVQTIATSGKPVLYADFQYGGSGGFLVYNAGFLRSNTPNIGFVASSRIDDVVAAVRCFRDVKKGGTVADFVAATANARKKATPPPSDLACKPDQVALVEPGECLARMKESKILKVEEGWPNIAPAIEKEMGIKVVTLPFAELNAAWEAADKDESKAIADRWQKTARRVVDVSRETLEQSAAMYLAEKAVLKKHGANAITINCLGGFYGNHIHAYPCLGFHELQNEGLIGACECDLRSTSTMVAMNALTQGRPGYISDPVIDTSSRQIIYAHCVAHNRAFGPDGAINPYEIMTHSEDRQGASVRSILPLGYMTTSVEFAPERKTILLHQGKAVANIDDDRACRTKLAVEPVGDIEKLFTEWDQWSWHRVTVYGDLKEPVHALAEAMGWSVLEEA
ncbi:MAG: hypothetical protein JW829_20845 [Pirellulales bacterium]|nr:hypothetical protein [Pirellulales bacterium]